MGFRVNFYCFIVLLLFNYCTARAYNNISDPAYKPLRSDANEEPYFLNDRAPDTALWIDKMEIEPSYFCVGFTDEETKYTGNDPVPRAAANTINYTERLEPKFPYPGYSPEDDILFYGRKNFAKAFTREPEFDDEFPDDKTKTLGFYVFGGMGLGFSMEYEKKLSKTYRGLGIRGGIGLAAFDISFLSIPLQLNYLIGGDGDYLELGAGITPLMNNGNVKEPYCDILGLKLPGHQRIWFLGSTTIGGRFSFEWTRNQKMVFRLGLSPSYGYEQVIVVPYINLDFPF